MGFASTSEVMEAVGLSERGVQGVPKRLTESGVVLGAAPVTSSQSREHRHEPGDIMAKL